MGSFVARSLSLVVANGITGRPDVRAGDLGYGFGDWDDGTSADDHDGYAQMDVEGGHDIATAAGGGGDERRVAGETSVPIDGDPRRRARVWSITTYRGDGSYQDGWGLHGRLVGSPGDTFRILSLGGAGDGVLAGGYEDCGPGVRPGRHRALLPGRHTGPGLGRPRGGSACPAAVRSTRSSATPVIRSGTQTSASTSGARSARATRRTSP
jgi:hypothetical protein